MAVRESTLPLSVLYNSTVNQLKQNQKMSSKLDMPIVFKIKPGEYTYYTQQHDMLHTHPTQAEQDVGVYMPDTLSGQYV
jgi:hypothetical protein